MNRGYLPGFYFDEQKQKYFKIQKDHVVPAGTKYAKSNVTRENRKAKKQRTETTQRALLEEQTVRRSRALSTSAGGIGLSREIGLQQPCPDHAARDAFILSKTEPSQQQVFLADTSRLTDAHMIVGLNHNVRLIAVTDRASNYYACFSSFTVPPGSWGSIMSSTSPIVSISTRHYESGEETQSLLVCSQQQVGPRRTNATFAVFTPSPLQDPPVVTVGAEAMSLGSPTGSLWSSASNPTYECSFAVCGNEGIYVVNDGKLAFELPIEVESRDLTWLDRWTVCYSHNVYRGSKIHGGVGLWDIRSNGTSIRFPLKLPITGLKCHDDNPMHVIASDNHRIRLFDTRMNKKPLFSFSHIHQGPRLQFTIDMPGVVAALDRDNNMQTYSLRTGDHIRTLTKSPLQSRSLITNPRYYDDRDDGGPILEACQDGGLVRWTL